MNRADLKWIALGLAFGLWSVFKSTGGDLSQIDTMSLLGRLTGSVLTILAVVYFARWVNRPKS